MEWLYAPIIDMKNANQLFKLALQAHQAGNTEQACNLYRQVLKLQPAHADACCNLGIALRSMGLHEEAIEYIKRALSLSPDAVAYHYNLGNALLELCDLQGAIAAYRQAVQLVPRYALAHYNLGLTLCEIGEIVEGKAAYRSAIAVDPTHYDAHLNLGEQLGKEGFLSEEIACYQAAIALRPKQAAAYNNLGLALMGAGQFKEAVRIKQYALELDPGQDRIASSQLMTLQYHPDISDAVLLEMARQYGERFSKQVRPPCRRCDMGEDENGQLLRIGFVSADLYQHTVGLFVKDVLKAHDPKRVSVFIYSAGRVTDWVTEEIQAVSQFRDIADLDIASLFKLIRQDEIDVLVDLSGHTYGSRLPVFALRPAVVQVSWLGYFATTGLSCMDAVLLDEWHAPPGTEDQFVEALVRLPGGRFCYQPIIGAPETVAPPPSMERGLITFGCFNNTSKLNEGVYDVWARVLAAVPNSRMVLKWRTFNDENLRQSVITGFAARGIARDRIELRGPSFHIDMLKEYADIDIALDPFPFSGGLTSCEALWMGVPVVTWPQSRVVSRQTFAFLSSIGLQELAAQDADDYVRISVALACDKERLARLRVELRARMLASSLMDVAGFTRQFEQCLIDLYCEVSNNEKVRSPMSIQKIFLHVGCGQNRKNKTTSGFNTPEWRELRFDIDPSVQPDIIGTMLDLSAMADESVDAIFSSHNIEHLYPHEVPLALAEFLRVLKPDGYLVLTCPDLQSVCQLVAEDKLIEQAYISPVGPIMPVDILYGLRASIEAGNYYMAHKCGFTKKVLLGTLQASGFSVAAGMARGYAPFYDLWVVASKGPMTEEAIREIAAAHFPA